MRITTTTETIEKVKTLLQTYDADTQNFLDDLPTREKYAILALAMMMNGYPKAAKACHSDNK